MKRGFIVRSGNALGLPGFIRVTIGTEAQNAALLSQLDEVLKQQGYLHDTQSTRYRAWIDRWFYCPCFAKAPETKIIGYDMDAQTREHAKTLNIVHDIVADPLAVAAEVDVIIFGTPVNATLDWMEQLKSWPLKNKVIVTDTGVQKLIMQKPANYENLG